MYIEIIFTTVPTGSFWTPGLFLKQPPKVLLPEQIIKERMENLV